MEPFYYLDFTSYSCNDVLLFVALFFPAFSVNFCYYLILEYLNILFYLVEIFYFVCACENVVFIRA